MRTLVSYKFKYYEYWSSQNEIKEWEIKALNKLDLKNKLLQMWRLHLVKLEKYRIKKEVFIQLKTTLPTKIYRKKKLFNKNDLLFWKNWV